MNQLQFEIAHPDAKLPEYMTAGAAAFDIRTIEHGTVGVYSAYTFETGLKVAVPDGFVLLLFSRSGHGFKNGIRLSNCVGVIDPDYRGLLRVKLQNDTPTPFSFEPGDRVAQGMLLSAPRAALQLVDRLDATVRGEGGYGSTGNS